MVAPCTVKLVIKGASSVVPFVASSVAFPVGIPTLIVESGT